MKKIVSFLLATGMICTLLTGCTGNNSAGDGNETTVAQSAVSENSGESGEEELEEYVYITHAVTLEFWKTHEAAVTAAAAALPGNCVGYMLGDAGSDPSKMETLLDTLIAKETLAGMVMAGVFPDVYGAAINKAWEKGIPSCTINADIPDSSRLVHLGTDEVKFAYEMSRVLHEKLGDGCQVIVSQNMFSAADTAKQRLQGIEQYASEHEGFEVVAWVDDKGDAATAAAVVSAAITANPDAGGVLGLNASSGIGAATGIREMGKTGDLSIVCVDPDETTVEAISNGEIYATVCGRNYFSVYLAVQIMHSYNHGYLRLVRDAVETETERPFPEYIDTGLYVINADNWEYFQ